MADPGQAPIEELRKAVALAQSGDWPAAHLIAQDHEGDRIANWIHAIVHRMEGDLSNSRYWYERCGRELDENVSTAQELEEIAKELAGPEVNRARGRS
jgi:hypothetical protein